jgi:TolA-binding protein
MIKKRQMKKTVSLMLTALVMVQCAMAQSVPDGIKLLQAVYKNKSAKDVLQKAYDANPKDPQAIYWLGIANVAKNREVLSADGVAAARAIYQKALQDGVNDPLIWVGQGTMDILESNNINAAKQKFEQAITTTTETKGKNKGKPNAAILNAIGFANSLGGSTIGDPLYGIEKLKQAAAIDLVNPDIMTNMGICFLKTGGENGGEAVKAFQDAISRDPKNARAMFRIGKVYQSQNNKESLEQYFNNAIAADPTFPAPYLELFNYYSNRDVVRAKGYLDDFLKYADKDPLNDFFYAEYLFRAGKYSESLAKAKEIEASAGLAAAPRLSLLYAYNYDRLGDSVAARDNVIKFFDAKLDIQSQDYELAVKLLSKFPGREAQTVGYLEQAIGNDTSKVNKLNYMNQAADLYGKAKMYKEQLFWLKKVAELKPDLSNRDFYFICDAAAKSGSIEDGKKFSADYIAKFPDQLYGYRFAANAAIAEDADTSKGTAVPAVLAYIDFLAKDPAKNARILPYQFYYLAAYYHDKAKDYPKTLEVLNKLLVVYPEDKYGLQVKPIVEKEISNPPAPPKTGNKTSGNTGAAPATKNN